MQGWASWTPPPSADERSWAPPGLQVLETCVKNCGHRFHLLVASQDFVEGVLVRTILPKNNPPTIVHDKVLNLIQVSAAGQAPGPGRGERCPRHCCSVSLCFRLFLGWGRLGCPLTGGSECGEAWFGGGLSSHHSLRTSKSTREFLFSRGRGGGLAGETVSSGYRPCPLVPSQSWADAFRSSPDLTGVVAVYEDLRRKGLEFPMTDLDMLSPIHTPQRVRRHSRWEQWEGKVGESPWLFPSHPPPSLADPVFYRLDRVQLRAGIRAEFCGHRCQPWRRLHPAHQPSAHPGHTQ